jgi:hypothetical protein
MQLREAVQKIAEFNPLEALGAQSRILTFGATAIASIGVHAMEAASVAVADTCTTVTTVESTTTVCGPDQTGPTTPDTSAPTSPATDNKPAHPKHQSQTGGLKAIYKNPFGTEVRNHTLYARRIDQGVDYSGTGPVVAMGDGQVTEVTTSSSYWGDEGGNAVVYRLSKGPAHGRSLYTSENCTPNPALYIGKRVFAGRTVICYMHDAFPYIESGWAEGGNGNDKPAAYSLYSSQPDGVETAYGLNASRLFHLLGASAGNSNPGHVSTNQGNIVGRLPDGFPRWPTHAAG